MSIGYVTIGAYDVEAALPFFDRVFSAFGYERGEPDGGWVFYGPKGGAPCVGLCRPYNGEPPRAGNGIMIAFKAGSEDEVRAAHAEALAAGGSDEGGPGYRPPEGTSFYGAYFRDLVGNKFCVYAAS